MITPSGLDADPCSGKATGDQDHEPFRFTGGAVRYPLCPLSFRQAGMPDTLPS